MGLWAMPYSDRPDGSKSMVVLIQRRGQRWHELFCSGRRGHYYEDGGCEHTDAVLAALTDYGQQVTKVKPFGPEGIPPKRFARRPAGEAQDG